MNPDASDQNNHKTVTGVSPGFMAGDLACILQSVLSRLGRVRSRGVVPDLVTSFELSRFRGDSNRFGTRFISLLRTSMIFRTPHKLGWAPGVTDLHQWVDVGGRVLELGALGCRGEALKLG